MALFPSHRTLEIVASFRNLRIALSVNVFAETIRINGKNYEQETGLPLAGASIYIKETEQSTVSQPDGIYHINAEVGQALIFGYLGMVSQEITVTVNSANIDVELFINTRQLTEVIITGALGIKRSSRELDTSAQFVDIKLK